MTDEDDAWAAELERLLDVWAAAVLAGDTRRATKLRAELLALCRGPEELALEHLRAGVRLSEPSSNEQAVVHFEAARELGSFDGPELAELDLAHAQALGALGRDDEAEPLLRRAVQPLLDGGQHQWAAFGYLVLGLYADQRHQDWAAAREWFEFGRRANALAAEPIPHVAEQLDVELARTLGQLDDWAGAQAAGRRAEATLRSQLGAHPGDSDLLELLAICLERLARANLKQARLVGTAGDLEGSRRHLEEAEPYFRSVEDHDSLGETLALVAAIEADEDSHHAIALYRESVDRFGRAGNADSQHRTEALLARLLGLAGEFAEAETLIGRALAHLRTTDDPIGVIALGVLAGAAAARGDAERANRYAAAAVELAGDDRELSRPARAVQTMLMPTTSERRAQLRTLVDEADADQDQRMAALGEAFLATVVSTAESLDVLNRLDRRIRQAGSAPWLVYAATLADLAWANQYERTGAIPAMVARLARHRTSLLSVGQRRQAARIALLIGARTLQLGRPHEALRHLVPAAMALNDLRFTLTSADQREKWATIAADGLREVCLAAAAASEERLLAEIVVTAHAFDRPTAVSPDQQAQFVDLMSDSFLAALVDQPLGTPGPGRSIADARRAGPPKNGYDLESGIRLNAPPLVVMPCGTLALLDYLDDMQVYREGPPATGAVPMTVPIIGG